MAGQLSHLVYYKTIKIYNYFVKRWDTLPKGGIHMTKVVLYGGHIYMVCISVPPCALAQEHFPPYNRTERLCGRACKSWYILNYRRRNYEL